MPAHIEKPPPLPRARQSMQVAGIGGARARRHAGRRRTRGRDWVAAIAAALFLGLFGWGIWVTSEEEGRAPYKLAAHPIPMTGNCLAVKQIGRDYRYFIRIENAGGRSFRGTLRWRMVSQNGVRHGWDHLDVSIAPGGHYNGYFDMATGPPGDHGQWGYSAIQFEAADGDTVVSMMQAQIGDVVERLPARRVTMR